MQESVRTFYNGYYRDIVTDIPKIEDGFLYPMMKPGLGLDLLPDFVDRDDVSVRRSQAS